MRDRQFLCLIHGRLEELGEKPTFDFMHKLRAIIRETPDDKETPNMNTCNSLESLLTDIERTEGA